MISISIRGAILKADTSLKTRTLKSGQEVTYMGFDLEDIEIDDREYNAMHGEPHAYEMTFDTSTNPPTLYKRFLKAEEFAGVIKGAFVAVEVGLTSHNRFEFKDCKLTKRRTVLCDGKVMFGCHVEVTPDLDKKFIELFERMGKSVKAELRYETAADQKDLPLNRHTDNGEQGRMSNTGKQINAAAERKERKRRHAGGDSLN